MVTASAMARAMALGADWCNSARAFMFAVGCIQSQRCHTNKCPVGVTTQDPKLQRALIVPDKAERVHNYHRNTVHALAELIAAMGLDHTSELSPYHAVRRVSEFQALALNEIYDFVKPGAFVDGTGPDAVPGVLGRGLGRVVPPVVGRGETPGRLGVSRAPAPPAHERTVSGRRGAVLPGGLTEHSVRCRKRSRPRHRTGRR